MRSARRGGAKLGATVTPVLIIILCASGDPDSAMVEALTRALQDAAGAATVQIRRVPVAPPDRELGRLAAREGAAMTAILSWRGNPAHEAVLRAYVAGYRRFEDRVLSFSASDRSPERGRALGLVIAAQLPPQLRQNEATPPRRPARASPPAVASPAPVTPPPVDPPLASPPPPASLPPPASPPPPKASATAEDVAALVDSPPLPASVIEEASERSGRAPVEDLGPAVVAPPPPPPIAHGWSMELGILGVLGLHGPAAGLGGTAGMRWHASSRWSFHLGARARAGQLQLAQASALTLGLGPGVICRLLPSGASRTSLSARADLLMVHESVSRFSSQQTILVRKGHLRPGGNALLELDFRVTDSALFGLAAGVEGVLARTDVVVRGSRVAVLPPLRLITEAGLRVHF
jgi:hypothetical protein